MSGTWTEHARQGVCGNASFKFTLHALPERGRATTPLVLSNARWSHTPLRIWRRIWIDVVTNVYVKAGATEIRPVTKLVSGIYI